MDNSGLHIVVHCLAAGPAASSPQSRLGLRPRSLRFAPRQFLPRRGACPFQGLGPPLTATFVREQGVGPGDVSEASYPRAANPAPANPSTREDAI